MILALFRALLVMTFAVTVGCQKEKQVVSVQDASAPLAAAVPPAVHKRPPLPGDFRRGWNLFREHCTSCHGANRRGSGAAQQNLPVPPADLRNPLLLAARTDAELADTILHGIPKKHRKSVDPKSEMPAFGSELGEQDAQDLVAFLRGDSIYLSECFPNATHYIELPTSGPKLLRAYFAKSHVEKPLRILDNTKDLPEEADILGYVMFGELELPGAGPTPVAFLTTRTGQLTGVRVALPEPDNQRAAQDIEAAIARGAEGAPKLRALIPTIQTTKEWLETKIAASSTPARPSHN